MASGKISPIPVEYPKDVHTMESSLANKGYARFPGTSRTFLPYMETPGYYRTGLDVDAAYIERLSPEEKVAEIKRIKEDKARLEKKTGFNLDPTSEFYNYGSSLPDERRVSPVKIGSSDVFLDLKDPFQEIAWNWIKIHPAIARSLDAYRRGDYSQVLNVQYYIADDQAETKLLYHKKKAINDAITMFNQMSPTKKKQVARLMGLPVTENTLEEEVYNLVDNKLKESEMKGGDYSGQSVIGVFMQLAKMDEGRLRVKDILEEAIRNSVYRVKQGSGRIYEGEAEVAASKQDFIEKLLDPSNQEDLIALESKLTRKKLARV